MRSRRARFVIQWNHSASFHTSSWREKNTRLRFSSNIRSSAETASASRASTTFPTFGSPKKASFISKDPSRCRCPLAFRRRR